MIVVAIIKLNDPVTYDSIFRWRSSEHDIPENSTKPETAVRIFTMMMDMILVKMRKQPFRPSPVKHPMTKK